jgi:hypothetical protein
MVYTFDFTVCEKCEIMNLLSFFSFFFLLFFKVQIQFNMFMTIFIVRGYFFWFLICIHVFIVFFRFLGHF